jgi:hypothetical protein
MANNTLVTDKPLIMDDEFSIKVSSKFGELWQSSPNNFMNLLSGSFGLPNGQFTLQGVQIWQSTDPINITIPIEIQMDSDSYEDVIIPTRTLMSLVVPEKSKMVIGKKESNSNLKLSTLIPPGPNLQGIVDAMKNDSRIANLASKFLEDFSMGSRGVYNVKTGFATFNNVIITSVDPTFSKEMSWSDTKRGYFPCSATLSVEISTMEIATTDMIANIF